MQLDSLFYERNKRYNHIDGGEIESLVSVITQSFDAPAGASALILELGHASLSYDARQCLDARSPRY